ncbi:MAG TPA: hypothetical protein VLV78_08455 [Thermoanaerobaculia bacterium]|nr:hypothetical protein [Thermoanaerobaculia bacterium]
MFVDDVVEGLLAWGEEIRDEHDSDVIAVDFRDGASVRAALIGVSKAFSLGALVPQLIALAFNVRQASDIESAVDTSGVPYAFVRRRFFMRSAGRPQNTFKLTRAREMVAMVIAVDGGAARATAAGSNHEIARTLSRIAGRPVVYVDVPENIARQSMRQLGMPASLIEGLLQHASADAACPNGGSAIG